MNRSGEFSEVCVFYPGLKEVAYWKFPRVKINLLGNVDATNMETMT